MSKAILMPLKKQLKKAKKIFIPPRSGKIKVSPFLLIKCVCAFLLSRTSLIGGALPLGYSFFAASFNSGSAYICALFSVLGLLTKGATLLTVGKYIISIVIFSLLMERFLPEKHKKPPVTSSLAALCTFVSGLFLLFADVTIGGYPLIYDSVVLIVECATIYICARSFSLCLPLLYSLKFRRALTAEETVSMALLCGGILCGFGTAGIGGVFTVTGTLCVLCVLIFAVRFGSLHGACAGIIMGIVCCISRGRIDACAASFALSGLCSGYFSKHGRWSACVSFVVANAVVTILSNGSTEVLINIFDTAIACVILYCMPTKIYDSISHFANNSPPAFILASENLRSAQSAVKSCEESFRHLFSLRNSKEANSYLLYRRTARKVCLGCGLRKYCWGRDAKATCEAMDNLSAVLHDGGVASPESAPAHCLRKEKFVMEFARMFELYKNDCMWSDRITEFRSAVYGSFSGIAQILGKSADNLSMGNECDSVAADELKFRLRKEGILTENIFVSGKKEETTVRITLESCGGFGRCENAVCKVLESMFDMPFVRTGMRNCSACNCTYVVKPSFSITTAVCAAIKANRKVSGDYTIYSLINRHTYAIILCDGMGSGETAREESRTSAKLLMHLLEAGIDAQKAIDIINAMLLFSFSGTLAAIDLCLISLDDGTSQIYKCGGAGTYAKTSDNVTHIPGGSLPAGSFASGDTQTFSIQSEKGSMVVLVSDGIISSENSNMPWIKEMIGKYDGCEPRELAQKILSHAKELSGNEIADDLTVVAAYIG